VGGRTYEGVFKSSGRRTSLDLLTK